MRETRLTITGVMLLHTAVVILHARAHLQIPVPISLEQGLFIGLIVILSPNPVTHPSDRIAVEASPLDWYNAVSGIYGRGTVVWAIQSLLAH
jgi:uncharacterized membrane protein YagU involved in acid resistance